MDNHALTRFKVLFFILLSAVALQCEGSIHQSCTQMFKPHYKVKCGESFGASIIMKCDGVRSDEDVTDVEVYHVSPSGRMNLKHRVQNMSGARCYGMYCLDVHTQPPYVSIIFHIGELTRKDIAEYKVYVLLSEGLHNQANGSFSISLEHDSGSCQLPPTTGAPTLIEECAAGKQSMCDLTCPAGYTLNPCNMCIATHGTDEIQPELLCEMKETCDCCHTKIQKKCCRRNGKSCGCNCCSKKKKRKCRNSKGNGH